MWAVRDHTTGVEFGKYNVLADALAYVREWRVKGVHSLSVVEV